MTAMDHALTVSEAVKVSGLTRRAITYAARTGKLTSRKLPGRTGAYLLNLDEVRRYAELAKVIPRPSGAQVGGAR